MQARTTYKKNTAGQKWRPETASLYSKWSFAISSTRAMRRTIENRDSLIETLYQRVSLSKASSASPLNSSEALDLRMAACRTCVWTRKLFLFMCIDLSSFRCFLSECYLMRTPLCDFGLWFRFLLSILRPISKKVFGLSNFQSCPSAKVLQVVRELFFCSEVFCSEIVL